MKIFLIAGEESGDILGAGLMQALKAHPSATNISFSGIGGIRMQEEGIISLFPMTELSVMGLAEIVPQIPHFLKRIRQTAEAIEREKPDVLVTIDAPDFSFRVARELQKRRLDVALKVHYVAPTVWAWRPKRAQKVASLYDAIFCLFPFEPPYFEKEGMKALFVGHPMCKTLENVQVGEFEKEQVLPRDNLKIGVLFGSRRSELERMGPVFVETIESLNARREAILICPTLPHLEENVRSLVRKLPNRTIILSDKRQKYNAMKICDAAMATSGTVGLELSVLGVPHVIAYKVSPLTYQIGKMLVKTKYAHLGNIILDQMVVPEFIQHQCNGASIADQLYQLIRSEPKKQAQKNAFHQIFQMIKGAENFSPSEACADFIIRNLNVCS